MARYVGPKCKLCRREGTKLFLKGSRCYSDKCSLERRNSPPGERKKRFRAKMSDYAIHLREKQKAKRMYGLLEQQFKNYFKKSSKMKGITGDNLLRMLETRLDSIVFRMGFAPSRNTARQLINHGHILVDGKKVDIPSFLVKAKQHIEIRGKSRQIPIIHQAMESHKSLGQYDWLEVHPEKFTGYIKNLPTAEQLPQDIDHRLIVEFYSK
ncbi:MAG: 30S ribosomal protein S4 [Candidatus Cloacimonetes bacterium]|nr:30S ribosomal protein S4 [Candidatus Cloacimonadota bacterium]MBL7085541.1 30S ribosomal protein S4 [Candidatus Cloacimonadota bacterium]